MEQCTVQKRQLIINSIEIETRKVMESDCKRNCSKIIAAADKQLIWQNVQCLNAFSLSEVAGLFQYYLDEAVNQSPDHRKRTHWDLLNLHKSN